MNAYDFSIDTMVAGICAFVSSFLLFIVIIPFILWIVALIDILKNEFTGSNKLIWFLVVTFLPLIGPILYYFIGTGQKIKDVKSEE